MNMIITKKNFFFITFYTKLLTKKIKKKKKKKLTAFSITIFFLSVHQRELNTSKIPSKKNHQKKQKKT